MGTDIVASLRKDVWKVLSKAEFLTIAGAYGVYIAAANLLAQTSNFEIIKAPSLKFSYS